MRGALCEQPMSIRVDKKTRRLVAMVLVGLAGIVFTICVWPVTLWSGGGREAWDRISIAEDPRVIANAAAEIRTSIWGQSAPSDSHLSALRACAEHENASVRYQCLSLLASQSEKSVGLFERALLDSSPDNVRLAYVALLGQVGPKGAVRAVARQLSRLEGRQSFRLLVGLSIVEAGGAPANGTMEELMAVLSTWCGQSEERRARCLVRDLLEAGWAGSGELVREIRRSEGLEPYAQGLLP